MFEQDTQRTYIESRAEEVLDIYTSINRSTIAVPDRAPEPAQAYIGSVYKDGLYHAYIYLYLATSNAGLLYRWSDGGVRGDVLNSVYQAAFEFTESMGFMLDNMHYRNKNPQEKAQLFAEVPLFHADLSFMKSQEPEPKSDELVIEPLHEEEGDVVAEEADEINLDALTDDEVATVELAASEDVTEITLGGQAESVVLGGGAEPVPESGDEVSLEEDQALGTLLEEPSAEVSMEVEEPVAPEEPAAGEGIEDALLDTLQVQEEAAPSPQTAPPPVEETEEITLEAAPDEQTQEAPPMVDAVYQSEDTASGTEEVTLTPEEAQVLGTMETGSAAGTREGEEVEEIVMEEEPPAEERAAAEEEEVEVPIEEPAPEPPPPQKAAAAAPVEVPKPVAPRPQGKSVPPPPEPPPPPAPKRAAAQPAAVAPLPAGSISAKDLEMLTRFLAMM
jgi:hypothetical protein